MASKYKAVRSSVDNHAFASKKEAAHYSKLRLMEKSGLIHSLTLQPEFPIWINGIKCFIYRADFSHYENGKRIITDVKGIRTPVYRLKRRCVEAYHHIKITEV